MTSIISHKLQHIGDWTHFIDTSDAWSALLLAMIMLRDYAWSPSTYNFVTIDDIKSLICDICTQYLNRPI
jgi:hypothetical protein